MSSFLTPQDLEIHYDQEHLNGNSTSNGKINIYFAMINGYLGYWCTQKRLLRKASEILRNLRKKGGKLFFSFFSELKNIGAGEQVLVF